MVLFTPMRAGLGRLGLALALVRAQCVARLLQRGCEQERHLLDWCLEGARSSPEPNAIAVGPLRRSGSVVLPSSFAATRIKRFFTTRYVIPCARSVVRIAANSETVNPR